MLGHPYLAAAIARLPIDDADAAPWCATAATDGYHIVVNSDFLAMLSDAEASFVLAHEVLHCVFGHPDRRKERDPETWNCATDYAINQLLIDMGFKMPAVGLHSYAFYGMAAETIHDLLRKPGSGREIPEAHLRPGAHGDLGDAARRIRDLPAEIRRLQVPRGGWCQQAEPGSRLAAELGSEDMPTELERQRIRVGLANEMRERAHGRLSGALNEEVRAATTRSVPWTDLLAGFITGIRQSDYRSYPFNKKHVYRGVYLPSVGAPGPRRLIVAIDTSGSIDAQIASRLLAEVDSLRSATECELTVIQCDAAVQDVQTFDPWDASALGADGGPMRLLGRGGTDFRPVFDWVDHDVLEGALPPDAIIYLTDGYGPFPPKTPDWPTVWIVTKTGAKDSTFPFGRVIRLDD